MYDNRRLFNVLTRHQIYVEGVKAQYGKEFSTLLRLLDKELRELFARLRFNSLDSLTKGLLREFLAELRTTQFRIYSAYSEKIINQIKDFMLADIVVSKILFATLYKESISDDIIDPVTEKETDRIIELLNDENLGLFPASWYLDKKHNGLWSNIINAPIPANGILLIPFVQGFVASASLSVENIVRKGYANRSQVSTVLDEITGTKAKNFRDGAFARINSQAGAMIATSIQHTTAITQVGLGSLFFGHYRWVSVIDSATTDICRGRNGKIYLYGEGPLPPAHIRCRSKVIPWIVGSEEFAVPTYYAFMKLQPNSIQNDILGYEKALRLREGKLKSTDMQDFDEASPISLEGFVSKVKTMLTR
jgi:SPP1 gp7 family putative phage head morphogenesis protein